MDRETCLGYLDLDNWESDKGEFPSRASNIDRLITEASKILRRVADVALAQRAELRIDAGSDYTNRERMLTTPRTEESTWLERAYRRQKCRWQLKREESPTVDAEPH